MNLGATPAITFPDAATLILRLSLRGDKRFSDRQIRGFFELGLFSGKKLSQIRAEICCYATFALNLAAWMAYGHENYQQIHSSFADQLRDAASTHPLPLRIAYNWSGYWDLFGEFYNSARGFNVPWDEFHARAAKLFAANVGGLPASGAMMLLPALTGAALDAAESMKEAKFR